MFVYEYKSWYVCALYISVCHHARSESKKRSSRHMYVHVCVCVCLQVCMFLSIYTRVVTCTLYDRSVIFCVCKCVCVCTYMHTCMHIFRMCMSFSRGMCISRQSRIYFHDTMLVSKEILPFVRLHAHDEVVMNETHRGCEPANKRVWRARVKRMPDLRRALEWHASVRYCCLWFCTCLYVCVYVNVCICMYEYYVCVHTYTLDGRHLKIAVRKRYCDDAVLLSLYIVANSFSLTQRVQRTSSKASVLRIFSKLTGGFPLWQKLSERFTWKARGCRALDPCLPRISSRAHWALPT
jgi:hypothetical protein